MKSHLVAIISRLTAMAESEGEKETRNFEREGVVVAEVTFEKETETFTLKYVETKELATFDSIDLVAIELFELLY
ncbi:hypothetical protein BG261_04485 [Floricoccus tropicus]|uniref:DUF1797 domain-containing protein n=2 Tax=Floricoccus TaxID=1930830 RepID=A0A1E8GKZ1_9LACT|nr:MULTISPECIES: DUF1797 family protein [Floricoccus]OFI47159.1 hypothetical protein BG262_00625 [Floricoccus penangensis]OFI48924.1 hypothetical protein BG261_04485 [Floricoccus tropicus]URZ87386.1 DUF1797 family protein [Floricoccus penangensis]